jgi:hypothetical protein
MITVDAGGAQTFELLCLLSREATYSRDGSFSDSPSEMSGSWVTRGEHITDRDSIAPCGLCARTISKGRTGQSRWMWPRCPHPKPSPLVNQFLRSFDRAGAYGRRLVVSRSIGSWTYRGCRGSFRGFEVVEALGAVEVVGRWGGHGSSRGRDRGRGSWF